MSLKNEVKKFWDEEPCGTRYLSDFESHARIRFELEPHIHAFAEFPSARGKRVLEIGTGVGSDYLEWVKAGAEVFGIDLSRNSILRAKARCESSGLAGRLSVADSECLPFTDSTFDLVYSYGVMHHSPNTAACIREAHRVLKEGGKIRMMIYNHPSMVGLMLWLRFGLIEFKGVRRTVYDHLESPGTKTFTRNEVIEMLDGFENIQIKQVFSPGDLLLNQRSSKFGSPLYALIWKAFPRALVKVCFPWLGLFLLVSATRKD